MMSTSPPVKASGPTRLVMADAHVHLYPVYDPGVALETLARQLRAHAAPEANPFLMAFLAESQGHDFFSKLRKQPDMILPHRVIPGPEDRCLTVQLKTGFSLCLVAGRQMATHERLEVLGLGLETPIPDGLSAEDTIRRIQDSGGLPVLPWALGKWLFARGKQVERLLREESRMVRAVGDSSMRPPCWPRPRAFKLAAQQGLAVLPGSDPLPFAGEERMMGAYGFACEGAFEEGKPLSSFRRLLKESPSAFWPVGHRSGLLEVFRRMQALRAAKWSQR